MVPASGACGAQRLTPGASDAAGRVLVDEVDLHLHPRWQQRVLPDLKRTCPNIQFIVSTQTNRWRDILALSPILADA